MRKITNIIRKCYTNRIIKLAVYIAILPSIAWALCSSYQANKIEQNYHRDNAFIDILRVVEKDRPELWHKIENSNAYLEFMHAYDNGDAAKEADDLMFIIDYEDPTYVADCLTGTDQWEMWQQLR